MSRLADFDLNHSIVKEKLAERFGEDVPLDEVVVSPDAIYASGLLDMVYSNYPAWEGPR